MTLPDLLIAGEIGKPHGIHGDVYVVRISDDPTRFAQGARLIHADGRELVIEDARPHRDRFLVKFEGVTTRDEAELLRGTLFVPASEVRQLERDEYWEHDLIGCEVVGIDGTALGTITAVVPGVGGASDLLEVSTESGTVLVPFVRDIVREADPAARRVVIEPPQGLFGAPS